MAWLLPACGARGLALPQSGDSERNFPNIQAPLYAFGRVGSDPGSVRAPSGLALGRDDELFVVDQGNHRIEVFSPNGMFRRSWGEPGSEASQFLFPSAVAIDREGEIYVADAGNGRIQVFSPEGRFLRQWGGMRAPRGLVVAGNRVYATDRLTHEIFMFTRQGSCEKVVGGLGREPGQFNEPWGVAVDGSGGLWVADSGNHRIQRLDRDGRPLSQWGDWGAQAGLLSYPAGLALSNDRVFVADRANHRIQVFDLKGTLVQQWGAAPVTPGQGEGRFHFPEALAVSESGGLTAVGEPFENRIQVFANREMPKSTRINDLPWWDSLHSRLHAARLAPPPPGAQPQRPGALAAADLHAVYFFDISTDALGPLAAVGGYGRKLGELNGVSGIAVDPEMGRAYVGDPGNRRVVLFELNRDAKRPEVFGRGVRVIAGWASDRGIPPSAPGTKPRAVRPGPLALGAGGRLHLLDAANERILVFGPEMEYERSIPVPPTIQEFAVGPDGGIYLTDPAHFEVQVYDRAGKRRLAFGRRHETAEEGFLWPFGVTVDDQGFIYVTDALLCSVRKFDPQGRPVTRWGKPGSGLRDLCSPRSIAFHKPGRLVVEDFGNHRAQAYDTEGMWLGTYVAGGLSTPLGIR
jgi:tripartite motif-containing protein 71